MAKRFEVKTNLGQLIDKARSALNAWVSYDDFSIQVYNDVYYFRFVEEGTDKMAPRAMVAESLPLIKEFLKNQIRRLGPFPTEAQIEEAVRLTEQYALDEIRSRTPIGKDYTLPNGEEHKAGTLVRGFRIEIVRKGKG